MINPTIYKGMVESRVAQSIITMFCISNLVLCVQKIIENATGVVHVNEKETNLPNKILESFEIKLDFRKQNIVNKENRTEYMDPYTSNRFRKEFSRINDRVVHLGRVNRRKESNLDTSSRLERNADTLREKDNETSMISSGYDIIDSLDNLGWNKISNTPNAERKESYNTFNSVRGLGIENMLEGEKAAGISLFSNRKSRALRDLIGSETDDLNLRRYDESVGKYFKLNSEESSDSIVVINEMSTERSNEASSQVNIEKVTEAESEESIVVIGEDSVLGSSEIKRYRGNKNEEEVEIIEDESLSSVESSTESVEALVIEDSRESIIKDKAESARTNIKNEINFQECFDVNLYQNANETSSIYIQLVRKKRNEHADPVVLNLKSKVGKSSELLPAIFSVLTSTKVPVEAVQRSDGVFELVIMDNGKEDLIVFYISMMGTPTETHYSVNSDGNVNAVIKSDLFPRNVIGYTVPEKSSYSENTAKYITIGENGVSKIYNTLKRHKRRNYVDPEIVDKMKKCTEFTQLEQWISTTVTGRSIALKKVIDSKLTLGSLLTAMVARHSKKKERREALEELFEMLLDVS